MPARQLLIEIYLINTRLQLDEKIDDGEFNGVLMLML